MFASKNQEENALPIPVPYSKKDAFAEELQTFQTAHPEISTLQEALNYLGTSNRELSIPAPYVSSILTSSAIVPPDTTKSDFELTPLSDVHIPHEVEPIKNVNDANQLSSEDRWQGWYEENSINLLLYIGAFLIVASAATFIGLTWNAFGGMFKAIVLTLGCAGFFGVGIASMPNEKIKQAAYTFIGIGAILIPFVGMGWHVFVLAPLGVAAGVSWFFMSVISLCLYFLLALKFKFGWYVYAGSFSILSLSLSLVRISNLSDTYYVLAAMFSCYVYLGLLVLIPRLQKEELSMFEVPLTYSSEILMPLALGFGFISVLDANMLYSFDASLAFVLAAIYYGVTYLMKKTPIYFAVTLFLWLSFSFVFMQWLDLAARLQYYVFFTQGALFVVLNDILTRYQLIEESRFSKAMGFVVAGFVLLISSIDLHLWEVGLMGVLLTSLVFYSERKIMSSYESIVLGSLSLFYVLLIYLLKDYGGLYPIISSSVLILYYFFGYVYYRVAGLSYVSSLLISLLTYLLTQYASLTTLDTFYVFSILAFGYSAVSHFAKMKFKKEECLFNGWYAFLLAGFLWTSTMVNTFITLHTLLLLSIQSVLMLYIGYIFSYTFLYAAPVLSLSYIINYFGFNIGNWNFVTYSVVYLIVGTFAWCVGLSLRSRIKTFYLSLLSGVYYVFLSLVFSFSSDTSLLTTLFFTTLLTLATAVILQSREWFVGFLLLFVWTLQPLFRLLNIPQSYMPFIYVMLGYVWYLVSFAIQGKLFQKELRIAALIVNGSVPILYSSTLFGSTFGLDRLIFMNRLMCVYASTILFAIDAYLYKDDWVGYLGSVYGLFAYVASLRYLNITETQFYTLGLGLYFSMIGYHREKFRNDNTSSMTFYLIGMFFVLSPTFLQLWGISSVLYAFLMVIYGLGYVAFGISQNVSMFRKIGFGAIGVAVFSQVYSVLSSLDWYVFLALGGIGILAFAVWLSNNKK